jgi:predicted DNA binding CopG/RHH family protein
MNDMGSTKKPAAARPKRVPAKMPKFKSEAEEAAWWDANADFAQFDKASKEGRVVRGLPERGATRSVTIRLALEDVEAAQAAAKRLGLPYQTYIKSLLHQALERERKAS